MIFKAIEKYRYGRWKTVSKHLNPEKGGEGSVGGGGLGFIWPPKKATNS